VLTPQSIVKPHLGVLTPQSIVKPERASAHHAVASYDLAFLRGNTRQASVDHNAQTTSTGWKNSRVKRAWSVFS